MDSSDLERVYLSKTDDELVALAAERKALEPEAQSVLWAELRRRRLTDPQLVHPRVSDGTAGRNLAFNLPAKIGALVMLVGVGVVGLIFGMAAAREHQFFKLVAIFAVFWGPIFAVIAWSTRRVLRSRSHIPGRNHRHEHSQRPTPN